MTSLNIVLLVLLITLTLVPAVIIANTPNEVYKLTG